MELSDHDLRQLDEEVINSLLPNVVKSLVIKLLADLKSARKQLNQNSQNSSRPPSSQSPWDKNPTHTDDGDDEELDNGSSEPTTEDDALKAAIQIDTETSSTDAEPEKDEKVSAPGKFIRLFYG